MFGVTLSSKCAYVLKKSSRLYVEKIHEIVVHRILKSIQLQHVLRQCRRQQLISTNSNGYYSDQRWLSNKLHFCDFFYILVFFQHCFICRPSDSTVSEDAEMEPREVAKSKSSAKSNPQIPRIPLLCSCKSKLQNYDNLPYAAV
jgi:hypothetical protein